MSSNIDMINKGDAHTGQRLAMTANGPRVQTVITWTLPSLDMPPRSMRVLVRIVNFENIIANGRYNAADGTWQIFARSKMDDEAETRTMDTKRIHSWAPATVDQDEQ